MKALPAAFVSHGSPMLALDGGGTVVAWRALAEALIDYRRRAPGAVRAHPSEEQLFPLHVVLGAAGSAGVPRRTFAGITEGALAMDV